MLTQLKLNKANTGTELNANIDITKKNDKNKLKSICIKTGKIYSWHNNPRDCYIHMQLYAVNQKWLYLTKLKINMMDLVNQTNYHAQTILKEQEGSTILKLTDKQHWYTSEQIYVCTMKISKKFNMPIDAQIHVYNIKHHSIKK